MGEARRVAPAVLDVQPEDELFAQAGRDVMTDITYGWRKPNSGPN